jgi:hypoxanthine phosphoribosyltransferase
MMNNGHPPSRIQVHDRFFRLLIGKGEIDAVVSRLAMHIDRDYSGKDLLVVGVLNGAFIFASDLVRKLATPCEISFVKYASYHGMSSSGRPEALIGLNESLRERHVLIVEDIIDTGTTMAALLREIEKLEPASLRVACFCFKEKAFRESFPIDYCGLHIPDLFVVGYGLDYNGRGRNLPDLYQLDEPNS